MNSPWYTFSLVLYWVLSDGPNVVNSISDLSLKQLWETSLVEVSVLATFLLITTFFEAVFLPQENFTIILFFACWTRWVPISPQKTWVMWQCYRSSHLLGWWLIGSMKSCRCPKAVAVCFVLNSLWASSNACLNYSGGLFRVCWV